jgi:hypothetical protein
MTLLCAAMTAPSYAQISGQQYFPPLNSETQVASGLFNIPDGELSHHFSIVLPKGGFLLVEFKNLSYWKDQGAFSKVVAAADMVADNYKDSMLNEQSSKLLEVHVPIKNEPITARLSQSYTNANVLSFTPQGKSILKLGMDTIRVVKNLEEKKVGKETEKVQLRYSFLLKDVSQIHELAQDQQWMTQTTSLIDSVVTVYRDKWKVQDAWYHTLYVNYDPAKDDKQRLVINKRAAETDLSTFGKVTFISASLGASLVRNTWCPNVEIGLGANLYSDAEGSLFTMLSMNTFYRYVEDAPNKFKGFTTTFINAEIGAGSGASAREIASFIPFYRISMGFGVKLNYGQKEYLDPATSGDIYKLFFNYSITKSLTVTPEFCGNFKNNNSATWIGLGIKLRFV